MRSPNEPLLLGRSFMAWVLLLFGIFDVMLAINISVVWIALMDMFLAGMMFSYWVADGIIESQQALIKKSLGLCNRAIKVAQHTNQRYLNKTNL